MSYDGDLNATFGKLFDNKHMVNAVVGMQVSDNKNKTSGFRAIGYVDDRNITPTFPMVIRPERSLLIQTARNVRPVII